MANVYTFFDYPLPLRSSVRGDPHPGEADPTLTDEARAELVAQRDEPPVVLGARPPDLHIDYIITVKDQMYRRGGQVAALTLATRNRKQFRAHDEELVIICILLMRAAASDGFEYRIYCSPMLRDVERQGPNGPELVLDEAGRPLREGDLLRWEREVAAIIVIPAEQVTLTCHGAHWTTVERHLTYAMDRDLRPHMYPAPTAAAASEEEDDDEEEEEEGNHPAFDALQELKDKLAAAGDDPAKLQAVRTELDEKIVALEEDEEEDDEEEEEEEEEEDEEETEPAPEVAAVDVTPTQEPAKK